MTARALFLVALAGALTLGLAWPTPARAQSSDAALAAELFAEGRALTKAGSCMEAKAKFAESARLDPRVGTFANMAWCDERLGHLAAARGDWQQGLDIARSRGDERLSAVEKQFARIDGIVPKLEIRAAEPVPPNFMVTVDGVALSAAALGGALPIDPGPHVIAATAPGRKRWEATLSAPPDGRAMELAIPVLEADSDAAAPAVVMAPGSATALPAPHEALGSRSGILLTSTLALLGVGAASVTTGTVFGLMAFGEKSAAQSACGFTYPLCDEQTRSAVDRHETSGRTEATVASIAFAAGAGSLLGSGALYLLWRSKARDRGALRVAPAIAWGTAALGLRGDW